MPKNKKTKFVRCAACSHRVPKSECVPYGEQWVCRTCDSEMIEEDNRRYEQDCENEVLRYKIGW